MKDLVQKHRQRLAMRGFKRMEVSVQVEDVEFIRRVVKTLSSNGSEADRLREILKKAVPIREPVKFQDWIASLPD